MSKRFLKIFLVLALLALGSTLLHAQSNEGALAGTILDPTGNVVAGANVIATNAGTGNPSNP